MTKHLGCLALGLLALAVPGCANTGIVTASTTQETLKPAKRGTPVVPGRPARMYVMAGFNEKTCAPIVPDVQIHAPPSKGTISFKPNQTTTVQFSKSGKCIGKKIAGIGIYYTANTGTSGSDSFAVIAKAGTGSATTQSFNVEIAE